MVKIRFGLIIFSLLSILTWLPPTTLAADCVSPTNGLCPTTNSVPNCFFSYGNGIKSEACCTSGTACTAYKQSLAGNASSISTSKARKVWNPQGSCTDGIDTALGCLPYKSEDGEFTSAILTFLAGITGAISLAVMLAATIQIMTAGGNPEQVKKGKELLTGAITGLLFIIFSVTLLRLIAGDIIQLDGFK